MSESKSDNGFDEDLEYTLEDTLETLKDTQMERLNQMQDLTEEILNAGPAALSETCTPEDLEKMQQQFSRLLLHHICKEEPKDYPIPETPDLNVQTVWEIEEGIRNAEELFDKMQATLTDIKQDIILKRKKTNLKEIQNDYLRAVQTKSSSNYYEDYKAIKRMSHDVNYDLNAVLETLFPNNEDYCELIINLLSAYMKGGDDIYVDVDATVEDLVHFLVDADIVSYHRNDRNKIRLMDML